MLCGVACQEVGAGGADLGAVDQEGDVRRRRVLATLLEAVADIVCAGLVAARAGVDARLHGAVVAVSGHVWHEGPSTVW